MEFLLWLLPLALPILAIIFRKWWLVILAILSLAWDWFVGTMFIVFGSLHPGLYIAAWTATLVGIALLLLRLKLRLR